MFGLTPWNRNKSLLSNTMDAPMQAMNEFRNVFDRMFNDFPMLVLDRADMPRTWGLNLEEADREVIVRAELPGFELNDLDVHLADNVLTIEAKHKEERKEGTNGENAFDRHVRRSITLPNGLNLDSVNAKYRNGVLEVHIARKEEVQGRRIEIAG